MTTAVAKGVAKVVSYFNTCWWGNQAIAVSTGVKRTQIDGSNETYTGSWDVSFSNREEVILAAWNQTLVSENLESHKFLHICLKPNQSCLQTLASHHLYLHSYLHSVDLFYPQWQDLTGHPLPIGGAVANAFASLSQCPLAHGRGQYLLLLVVSIPKIGQNPNQKYIFN